MAMAGDPIRFLFLFLCTCLFLAGAAGGTSNGYTVAPFVPETGPHTPVDMAPVDLWELPPGVLLIFIMLPVAAVIGFPAELYFLIKLYACLGYRKIERKTILENAARNHIFSTIRDHPGISIIMLARMTGVNRGTLRYHLRILRFTGKITVLDSGKRHRFFENSGKYSDTEKILLKYLRNETESRIFRALLEMPSLSRTDLSTMLGVAPSTVSWRMNRLKDVHLISSYGNGRFLRYEITSHVRQYVEKYLATPVDTVSSAGPGQVSESA